MPYTPAHNLPDPDFDPESSRPGRELAIEAEASAKVIAASRLPELLPRFLAGEEIDEPFEYWD